MRDRKYIERFCDKMGFQITSWTKPSFICDEARKQGAVESINLSYDDINIDINFELDKKGNLVGISTSNMGSFRKR